MVYKWYILPIGGLYGTYHLLREPGNSIDLFSGLISDVNIYIYTLELVCPLFWGFNPPKRRPFAMNTGVIWVPDRANYIPKV